MKRKIIQIAATPDTTDYYSELYALCDDGTVWRKTIRPSDEDTKWKHIEDVPQD